MQILAIAWTLTIFVQYRFKNVVIVNTKNDTEIISTNLIFFFFNVYSILFKHKIPNQIDTRAYNHKTMNKNCKPQMP